MKKKKSFYFYFGKDGERIPEESAKIDLNETLGGETFDMVQAYEEWMADIEKDYYSSNFKETNND